MLVSSRKLPFIGVNLSEIFVNGYLHQFQIIRFDCSGKTQQLLAGNALNTRRRGRRGGRVFLAQVGDEIFGLMARFRRERDVFVGELLGGHIL